MAKIKSYNFCHTHIHTEHSILDGCARVGKIVEAVKRLGQEHAAITDHGCMSGAMEFYLKCKELNINPLIGVEAYVDNDREKHREEKVRDQGHLILIAKNRTGYKNLCRITSEAHEKGFYYKPLATYDVIKKFSEGIICTTACGLSPVGQKIIDGNGALEEVKILRKIFGDNLYLEIQFNEWDKQHLIDETLVKYSRKLDIPLVVGVDVHYIEKIHHKVQDVLLCINQRTTLTDPKRFCINSKELYLKNAHEVFETASRLNYKIKENYLMDAMKNTVKLAERCKLELKLGKPKIPSFTAIEKIKISADELLQQKCKQGLRERIKNEFVDKKDKKKWQKQIKHELSVIKKLGFADYLLIIADIIKIAKKLKAFIGPGRGCLHPDTMIVCENGETKRILDIELGERIWTKNGNLREVKKTFKYPCNEKLYNIKTYYGDYLGVSLTGDHKILAENVKLRHKPYYYDKEAYRSGRPYTKYKVADDPKGKLEWIRADKLKERDWVFVPKPKIKEVKDYNIDLAKFANGYDIRYSKYNDKHYIKEFYFAGKPVQERFLRKIERFIELDENWYWIFGLFAGDGWFRSDRESEIGFVFNYLHKSECSFTENFFKELGANVRVRKYKKTFQVIVNSKIIYKLFSSLFNRYKCDAKTKHVPQLVINSKEKFVKEFLRGYIFADGSVDENKITSTTVSETLADQLRFLCWRLLIPVTIRHDIRNDKREEFKNHKGSFVLTYPLDKKLCHIHRSNQQNFIRRKDGLLLKIRKIEKEDNRYGYVCDLEVEREHNYLTSSFIVHNSAAGSRVCFCLGITNINPEEHGLIFERFLNLHRFEMPDIDIDFDSETREKIIDAVKKKYGEKRVRQIISVDRFHVAGLVRDLKKVLEYNHKSLDRLSWFARDTTKTWKQHREELEERKQPGTGDINYFIKSKNGERFLWYLEALDTQVRHLTRHPAGYVIAPKRVDNYVPLQRVGGKDGELCVSYTEGTGKSRYISKVGLLKVDFLGLITCSIIRNTLSLIKKHRGKDYTDTIWKVNPKDKKILKEFCDGNTMMIFQFESEGITKYVIDMKPNSLSDIAIANACYRPAVLESGQAASLIETKNSGKVSTGDKELNKILRPTYGSIVFEEQFLQIFHKLAGFDLDETDSVRREVKKPSKTRIDLVEKELNAIENRFIKGCLKNKNCSLKRKRIKSLWEIMKSQAVYGFNKAHASAYALIAWQTMWLKTRYPKEFVCAVLNARDNKMVKNKYGDKTVPYLKFLGEGRRLEIKLFNPDINKCGADFKLMKNGISFGLACIKHISDRTAKAIEEAGPFKSVKDFYNRAKDNNRKINKRAIENLINVNGFSEFGSKKKIRKLFNKYRGKKDIENPEDEWQASNDAFGFIFYHPFLSKIPKGDITWSIDLRKKGGERNRVCVAGYVINVEKRYGKFEIMCQDQYGYFTLVVDPKRCSVDQEHLNKCVNGKLIKAVGVLYKKIYLEEIVSLKKDYKKFFKKFVQQ